MLSLACSRRSGKPFCERFGIIAVIRDTKTNSRARQYKSCKIIQLKSYPYPAPGILSHEKRCCTKEKIQILWIPFIGLTAPKANVTETYRHCGEGCKNNSRSEYGRTDICCELSCVSSQWTPCHQTLGSFSPLTMLLVL